MASRGWREGGMVMADTGSAQRVRVAVIGKGLIGSAAARHLAQQTRGVLLIGPDEPAVRTDHHDVFGSHYDEGRIYRILDGDPIWGRLAERSIARYAEIEAQSGIRFHEQVGMLAADMRTPPALAVAYARTGEALDASFEHLTGAELAGRFPYLRFNPETAGLFELQTGGHISPPPLVGGPTAAAERPRAAGPRGARAGPAPRGGGGAGTTPPPPGGGGG